MTEKSPKMKITGKTASVAAVEPIQCKTKQVIRMLGCGRGTLWLWEKKCPRLFSPVLRQRSGNIYRIQQIRIMADVMVGLETPEAGAELWERTLARSTSDLYRAAGDTSR